MFSLPAGDSQVEGASDETAIPLPGVTIRQFESLLDFFYFRQSIEESSLSIEEWTDLLAISTRFDFDKVRKRAIKEIENSQPPVDPVTKVMLANKHDIPQWLQASYVSLCERSEPLEEEEAEKLGLSMTVKVAKLRERYRASYGADPAASGYNGQGYSNQFVLDICGV